MKNHFPVLRRSLNYSVFRSRGVPGSAPTYVRQEIAGLSEVLGDDRDAFVVVDAALGYRLPKRFGIMSLGVRNLVDEEFQFQDTVFGV
jgi:hypothetical protein